MKIAENATLASIRAAKPEMIYYGARTTWWTHDPAHLFALEYGRVVAPDNKTGAGLPCDPRGGVLFQTDDVERFLSLAESNAAHYGKHGLAAFMGAHALNCLTDSGGPWAAKTFEEINQAIDQQQANYV